MKIYFLLLLLLYDWTRLKDKFWAERCSYRTHFMYRAQGSPTEGQTTQGQTTKGQTSLGQTVLS